MSLGATHYIEWHTCIANAFISHLVSLITEGGVAWCAPIMWRLDAEYKALREEVPWLKKRPTEYLRDHVRFSSQPLEMPDRQEWLLQILEMMDAERTVMFASDYPHWDFDSPTHAFPPLPERMHRRIFRENALELYGLADGEARRRTG